VEVEGLTLEHLCDGDDGDVRVPHFFVGASMRNFTRNREVELKR
jgi:hypothetical protein